MLSLPTKYLLAAAVPFFFVPVEVYQLLLQHQWHLLLLALILGAAYYARAFLWHLLSQLANPLRRAWRRQLLRISTPPEPVPSPEPRRSERVQKQHAAELLEFQYEQSAELRQLQESDPEFYARLVQDYRSASASEGRALWEDDPEGSEEGSDMEE